MKNLIVFAMVIAGLTILNGCQKEELINQSVDVQLEEAVKPDVYVENDYLVFNSKEVFDSIRLEIENYEIEKSIVWEQSLNFVSAKTERHYAEEELDNIDNQAGFQDFKRNYNNSFNISDEFDINYKFYASSLEDVLNIKGEVKIGGSLYKFTDKEYIILDGDYKKLKNLDSNLKSGTISDDSILVFDPNSNNSQLKSYDKTDLGSGEIFNNDKSRRLDYHVEKIVYSGFGGVDYMHTGKYYYLEGYELNLVMRQKRKNIWGNWTSMSASYYISDQNLHWRPYSQLSSIKSNFNDANYSTGKRVIVRYVNYHTKTFGTAASPYFWVYSFKAKFYSSGVGSKNAVNLEVNYF